MKFYSRIFSHFYDPVLGSFEQHVLSERRKFLLQDITPPVLEIGAGTGVNLFYYPFFNKDFRLTIIEKNPFMVEKIKQKFPEISSRIDFIVDSIENQSLINHLPKFNSIVSTLTLCSVNDLGLTISHIKQLLEKQGIFYLIEHIRSKKNFYGTFQDIISPGWKLIGDGCHINRNTDVVLKQAFTPIYEEYFFSGIDFYLAKMKLP